MASDGIRAAAANEQSKQVWRSSDVEAFRGFEYYRNGICKSFMDLIPEPDREGDWDFSGSVETMPIGSGRINRVSATAHLVLRTHSEIARAPEECFYLNFKTRGECRINQSGEEVVIRPGDVGFFDSTKPFALEHRRKPDLAVASFMIPHRELANRLPGGLPGKPALLSSHPHMGYLIRETAATLSREADFLQSDDSAQLYEVLLNLTAMAIKIRGGVRVDAPASRSHATFLSIRNHIDKHHTKIGFSVSQVASAFQISARYLHKLFSDRGMTFGEYLLERRLQSAMSSLQSLSKARLPIASIAYESGFSDPAYFHRAFKRRFGCTASEWRNGR